jgi:hypothetical protein
MIDDGADERKTILDILLQEEICDDSMIFYRSSIRRTTNGIAVASGFGLLHIHSPTRGYAWIYRMSAAERTVHGGTKERELFVCNC